MSLHNIIGSEAYLDPRRSGPSRDVWAGMLRFVRSRKRRSVLFAWMASVVVGFVVTAAALLCGVPDLAALVCGVGVGGAVRLMDGWTR